MTSARRAGVPGAPAPDLPQVPLPVHGLVGIALHHRQPDPGAAHQSAVRRRALVEGFENLRALIERDAGARVRDIDHEVLVVEPTAHGDGAAIGCELHRVRDQVVEDQLELGAVRADRDVVHLQVDLFSDRSQVELLWLLAALVSVIAIRNPANIFLI